MGDLNKLIELHNKLHKIIEDDAYVKEELKDSEYCVYLVLRRHWFVGDFNEIRLDVGQYVVEEIYCPDSRTFNDALKRFSSTLEDDEDAIITNDPIHAYYTASLLNEKINQNIIDCVQYFCEENKLELDKAIDFSQRMFERCYKSNIEKEK